MKLRCPAIIIILALQLTVGVCHFFPIITKLNKSIVIERMDLCKSDPNSNLLKIVKGN
jgi:hypothetical protein